jgi:hypothetical protein
MLEAFAHSDWALLVNGASLVAVVAHEVYTRFLIVRKGIGKDAIGRIDRLIQMVTVEAESLARSSGGTR